MAACTGGEPTTTDEGPDESQDEADVIVGQFAPNLDTTLKGGGVVVGGASLAGREDNAVNLTATVTVAGIPAGATVSKAYLYWAISGGTDNTALIGLTPVTGTLLRTAGQTCWNQNNTTYRADVTAQVTGNGNYTISGLPSALLGGADTDGVTIMVVYQVASSGVRHRIIVRDGAITTSEPNDAATDTFTGLTIPAAGAGKLTMVVGDGQTAADGAFTFSGQNLGTSQWQGAQGSLWDNRQYNVNLTAAQTTAAWTSVQNADCLLYVASALDYTAATCGNGVITGGEGCDDGNTANNDGCSSTCEVETGYTCTGSPSVCTATCGDGIKVSTEACDDGNNTNGDGCNSACAVETGYTCTGSPSVCTTTCGDGVVAGGEACDDGNTTSGDGCNNTCGVETGYTCAGSPSVCATTCGDGIIAGGETCDDGNAAAGDGCSATCAVETGYTCVGQPSVCVTTCGDGVVAGGEACDDGNILPGDGCNTLCMVEDGYSCTGSPSVCSTNCGDGNVAGAETCDDGNTTAGDGCSATCQVENGYMCVGEPSVCIITCGDGIVVGAEECDDGNILPGDGCDSTCMVENGYTCTGMPSVCTQTCGDGVITGGEQCDDGNTTDGDGCDGTCKVENGYTCTGMPSVCATTCGDGVVSGAEACDDGNTTSGDGCDSSCKVEDGYTCTGNPSVCTAKCGDGVLTGNETCDDGNATGGDGCSATCTVEDGYQCVGEPSVCSTGVVAGGACDAGAGGSAGWLAMVGLAGLALVKRRRRAASAATAAIGAVAVASILGASSPASADTRAYSAERFNLSMDKDGILSVESPHSTGFLAIDIGLWVGYADSPLVIKQVSGDHDQTAELIDYRLGGELVGSVGLGRWLQVGVAFPLVISQDEGSPLPAGDSLESFGLGDITITPKLALLHGRFGLALAAQVTLPSHTHDDAYFGDDKTAVAPMVIFGYRERGIRWSIDAGYRARKELDAMGLKVDDEVFADVGIGVRLARPVELMGTFSIATPAAHPFDDFNTNFMEVRGGLGFDLAREVRLFAAGGAGLAAGWGTPDWRVLGGLWFGANHEQPHREVRPEGDRDGDGIVDSMDKCPDQPEDKDGFQDEDGCPDPDNDGDGILDAADKCPNEPETKNGFQDDDGCPDSIPDTDGDGIPDTTDKCPTEPEDKDGFEDEDGCPDPDNDKDGVMDEADRCRDIPGPVENGGCPDTDRDGDGIVDRLDNCPDEKGTVKNHGCKEKQLVVFDGSKIALLDVVYFKLNKAEIEARSNKLLTNVATVLKAHPEVQKVTVEGHTDSQGDDAYNLDLSQRRAQAVVDFLVKLGVPSDKLTPIGYGETRPIADNKTVRGRAANRRVEFKLSGISAIQTTPPGPPPETIEKK